ncbi:dihydroorotase [Candidatus Parcubacteria bacterium]|nr:dihydroorotase [Candidatus Parcubacteria bacterium]
MDTMKILKPFDAHVHLRDGELLRAVVPFTARQCWGAIAEPNLKPPITTRAQARSYADRITAAAGPDFVPFVLAYFTDTLDPQEFVDGLTEGDFFGVKFYPRGATTNSENGIEDVSLLWTRGTRQFDIIEATKTTRGVVQLHGEANFTKGGEELDPYDKETYFYTEIMPRLQDAHPQVKFSGEHITTSEAAAYARKNGGEYFGVSVTAHHLLIDRRDVYRGGYHPHSFCLPVVKRVRHTEALHELLYGDHSFVWAGSDSAPHDWKNKESECCSGGVFSAPAMVELYAQAAENIGLQKLALERFLSRNAPAFYTLTPPQEYITLEKTLWDFLGHIEYGDSPTDYVRYWDYPELKWRMKYD